ncbi:alpha-mannosidase [Butyrivibrio sp. XBB1001]|uniref:alpha-mannosidase n=1 Tax=Butyrivibrio sp. XBB1001 TaxID=1280682 RepID=UPI0003F88A9A|nr:glycoside hydrolase family 38 C-terminal domain-containing protein [Butyrivibrio sp. XBB1001]
MNRDVYEQDMNKRLELVENTANRLKSQMFGRKIDITSVMNPAGIRHKKVGYGQRKELFGNYLEWDKFQNGDLWGEPDGHDLFRVKVTIPEEFSGREVFFFLSTGADDIWNTDNPQMLVYINGVRRSGMDMNHNCVSVYGVNDWKKNTDRIVDIAIYGYSNLSINGNYLKMELAALDEAAKNAFFDISVAFDAAKAMLGFDSRKNAIDLLSDKKAIENNQPVDSKNADKILNILVEGSRMLQAAGTKYDIDADYYTKESMTQMSVFLHDNLYGREQSAQTVASTGHTHIDVAWKWPVRQTREKVIRSYSTVMELMKRYPEYLFMASTPQMYEFVREDEPELFEEIKERVKEGRFEPEGAMWLEADCNLTSGESLVRQILYGKRYFKEVFGVDSNILWLPDVFGYSAAMPQILKKSGIRAFVTTKLAWNDTNRMPHDLFMWKGIDGTMIPTYLITTCDLPRADMVMREGGILNYTYNGRQDASQIMGTWRAFREKDITNETLTVYGFGDGGGGPTWEMLEQDRRLREGIPGCPVTVQKSVTEFMDGLLEKVSESDNVPEWEDELYLEFHRGTYTSMGKNKRYNRRLEHLLKEAEILLTYAHLEAGLEYPAKELMEAWKILMLNQFHDILPGSSIEEVYQVSEEDYKRGIHIVEELIKRAILVFNISDKESDKKAVKKSTNGIIIRGASEGVRGLKIETNYYVISFDEKGEIISLYDKEIGGEIRDMTQTSLNRLIAFKDEPLEYDAWNIDANFEDISFDITDLSEISVLTYKKDGSFVDISETVFGEESSGLDGDFCELHLKLLRKFCSSTISQTIVIRNDERRIDFRTKVDWHEHQILLKAAFPVNIDSREITCEIQFGDIKRNLSRDNSWDRAKFECCAHRWMDISDRNGGNYGVAVLNDCKYGYDAKEKMMRLTLIKSGIFPNPNADQGEHEFTYSLLPHPGDHREGNVIEEAEALNGESHYYVPKNDPLSSILSEEKRSAYNLVKDIEKAVIDLGDSQGVYIDAIKLAEDSGDIIIRLHEGHGRSRQVNAVLFSNIRRDISIAEVYECDLLEKRLSEAALRYFDADKKLSLYMEAYEIKTIRIVING